MYTFGDKDKFGIGYQLYTEKYADDESVIANPEHFEWECEAFFWVNGKNIFQVRDQGPDATFVGEVSMLLAFFCEYLHYHIINDPFPMKTMSTIGIEMMDETCLVEGEDNDVNKYLELDWDKVDMDLHQKKHIWNINHGIIYHGAGLFLPAAYMQKVENKVEISWDAHLPHHTVNGDFFFEYVRGVEYVDIKFYKDTVVEFCQHVMEKFKIKYPELMEEFRQNLQKAIDIDVSSTH
jgi:hypothetical protein